MPDNFRHAQYDPAGIQIDDPQILSMAPLPIALSALPLPAQRPIGSGILLDNLITNSNATGPKQLANDGTQWRLLAPADLLVDTAFITGAANTSEQFLKSYNIPANLLRMLRYFEVKVLYAKSGAAETCTLRARLGTAGNASDVAILTNSSTLSGTNRAATIHGSHFASSNTQLRGLGRDSGFGVGGFIAGGTTTTYPTNYTVPALDVTPLILTISAQMSVGAETATIAHVILSGG